eukprot:1448649-Prymnesium_polylepis.1
MLNVLRPSVRPYEVRALAHYFAAPAFSLEQLNAFYLWPHHEEHGAGGVNVGDAAAADGGSSGGGSSRGDGNGDGAGGDGAGGNGAGGDGAADRWIGRGGAVVPGATFLARSLPEASSVQLAEGVSLPLRLADGDAGLVL